MPQISRFASGKTLEIKNGAYEKDRIRDEEPRAVSLISLNFGWDWRMVWDAGVPGNAMMAAILSKLGAFNLQSLWYLDARKLISLLYRINLLCLSIR